MGQSAAPIIAVCLVSSALLLAYSSGSHSAGDVNKKASRQLLARVELREEQIANPGPDRLELMRNTGMNVDNELNELADKDFVVRLETAERVLQPQQGSRPMRIG